MSFRNFLRYFLAIFCFWLTVFSFTEFYFAMKQAETIKFYTLVEFVVPEGTEVVVNDQPVDSATRRGTFITFLSTQGRYHIVLKRNGSILKEIFDYSPQEKGDNKLILK